MIFSQLPRFRSMLDLHAAPPCASRERMQVFSAGAALHAASTAKATKAKIPVARLMQTFCAARHWLEHGGLGSDEKVSRCRKMT